MDLKRTKSLILTHWDLIGLVVIVAFGLLSVRTFFGEGYLSGWDHPVNLVNSYYTARSILSGGSILFYDPFNNLGWVVNQYHDLGAQLFIAIIYMLTGSRDINIAYKTGVALAYVLMAPAIYFMTRSLSGSKVAGVASGFSSIVVTSQESAQLDAGLLQVYETGMWSQRLGIAFGLTSLGFLILAVRLNQRLSMRLAVASLCGLFLGASFLTNAMAGISSAIAAVIFAAFYIVANMFTTVDEVASRGRKLVRRITALGKDLFMFGIAVLLALGISASWILGYLSTSDLRITLAQNSEAGPWIYLRTFYSIDPVLTFLGLLAIAVSAIAAKGRSKLTLVVVSLASFFLVQLLTILNLSDGFMGLRVLYSIFVLFIVTAVTGQAGVLASAASMIMLLFLASGPTNHVISLPWTTLDVGKLIPYSQEFTFERMVGFARFLLIALSGIGFATVCSFLYSYLIKAGARRGQLSYLSGLVLGIFVFTFLNIQFTPHTNRTDIFTLGAQPRNFRLDSNYSLVANLKTIMNWTETHLPANTRVLYQDTLTDLGDGQKMPVSHYFFLSSYITGKPSLGGSYDTCYITDVFSNTAESTIFGKNISMLPGELEKFYSMTGELGVGYVAIFDPDLRSAMDQAKFLFEVVYVDYVFSIYRRKDFAPIAYVDVVPGNESLVDSFEEDINHLVVKASDVKAGSNLTIRSVNYPGWTAMVNGKEVAIESVDANLPSVYNIGGQTIYNVRVPYINIRLDEGDNDVVLSFRYGNAGDNLVVLSLISTLALSLAWVPGLIIARRKTSAKPMSA